MSARYSTALRLHLLGKRRLNGDRAQRLGRAALAGGWVVLDLARMHEKAMGSLPLSFDHSATRRATLRGAGFFFIQVLIPLEAAQRATKETNRRLLRSNGALQVHNGALVKGNRQLEREITRRKAGEVVIRQGREQYQKLFLQSQVMERKLRHLARQFIAAQEEERKEISRELHDEVVQTLVGINVQLSAVSKGASVGLQAMKAEIVRTQRLVECSVHAMHRFARELRPAALDHLGLIPALHAYSRSLAARKKIKIELTVFRGVESLPSAKRTVLYRVAQEALTNVVRHSQATQVKVSIVGIPGAIRMEISDNGKSFPVEQVLQGGNSKRLGLIGMKERIEMVGGNLAIKSSPEKGTVVRAEIPLDPKENRS